MSDEPGDPAPQSGLRAGDADREAAAERLRSAVAEGHLELTELDGRLAALYAARTRADLQLVTADLPASPDTEAPPLELRTKSGSLRKDGYWRVPASIAVDVASGSARLDFTEADCPHRVVEVRASTASGAVVLIVPRGWSVDLDRIAVASGSVVNRVKGRPAAGAPVVRVQGEVRSGKIKARHPRRSFWAWLLRRAG